MSPLLIRLHERLAQHQPSAVSGWNYPEAAVLLAITREQEPQLILTRRADHLNTHSGQVAFPGGKRDPEDASLLETALREAWEEIRLPPEQVEVLGQLGELISLHGIRVTPFVGLIPPDLDLQPCEQELDQVFKVPLHWLMQDLRTHTDQIQVQDQTWYVPSYQWQEHTLWGLSAMMLVELLQAGLGLDICLQQCPEGPVIRRAVRPFPPQDKV